MQKKFHGYLICTDIDGTLTDSNGKVSALNCDAIKYFQDNGGLFTVSTGRVYTFLEQFKDDFKVNAPVIHLNGTSIYDTLNDEILFETSLNKRQLDSMYMDIMNNFSGIITGVHIGTTHSFYDYSGKTSDYPDNIMKLVFHCTHETDCVKLRQYLENKYPQWNYNRSWNVGLEVIPKNSGKGICISLLKKWLGSRARVCVAIGDYENDVSMMEACDIGYAVANSVQALKDVAHRITVSNNESAISAVIEDLEKEL